MELCIVLQENNQQKSFRKSKRSNEETEKEDATFINQIFKYINFLGQFSLPALICAGDNI